MEWFAVWNSSSNTCACCTTWVADFRGLPCLATFLLCYILHAIIESTSKISFPTCWTNIRYHTRSTNSLYLTPWASKLMPNWTQTSRVALHSQKRCPLFSLPNPHASHISSSITYWWHKFTFMRMILRHTRHAKDFVLLGKFKPQSLPQKVLWSSPFEIPSMHVFIDSTSSNEVSLWSEGPH